MLGLFGTRLRSNRDDDSRRVTLRPIVPLTTSQHDRRLTDSSLSHTHSRRLTAIAYIENAVPGRLKFVNFKIFLKIQYHLVRVNIEFFCVADFQILHSGVISTEAVASCSLGLLCDISFLAIIDMFC